MNTGMLYRRELSFGLILTLLLSSGLGLAEDKQEERHRIVRLPSSILLNGFETRIGFNDGPSILLSTPNQTINLNKTFGDRKGHVDALSRDGKLVATVICRSALNTECGPTAVTGIVSSVSIPEGRWTDYIEADAVGQVSIAPDRTMLAFVANRELHIFDVDQRTDRIVGPGYSNYTWSPDSTELAYEVPLPERDPDRDVRESRIDIINLKSGRIRTLARLGHQPSWSPSGEWIAFLDSTSDGPGGKHCIIIHPDGSNEHTVVTAPRSFIVHSFFGGQAAFWQPPVWSPDSSALLLNAYWDWETLKTDVYCFDLQKGRLKLLMRDAYPVMGWAKSD